MKIIGSHEYALNGWNIGEDMPAVSKSQRRFMAMCEHGKATKSKCPKMSKSQMHDFAATKEKGLKRKKIQRRKRSEWGKLNGY